MQIQRAQKLEWNLNTWAALISVVLNLAGIAGAVWWASATWSDFRRDVVDLEDKDVQIERSISDLSGRADASVAKTEANKEAISNRVSEAETSIIRLSDRVSADGARLTELGVQMQRLLDMAHTQSGDLKVIISRIDEQRRRDQGLPPGPIEGAK